MDATLTGRAAAEAIGLCLRLGREDARFDASRVGRALRSRIGRRRLRGALTASVARLAVARPRATRAPRSSRRSTRLAFSAASPDRPRPIHVGDEGAPPFENGWGNA